MVQALLNSCKKTSRVFELQPEFIEKIRKIKKQKSIPVKDFAKRYGI